MHYILAHSSTVDTSVEINLENFLSAEGVAVSGTVVLENVAIDSLRAAQFVFANGVDWQALIPAGVDY
jgi:hypothetical protein